jgi:hypothetical protein
VRWARAVALGAVALGAVAATAASGTEAAQGEGESAAAAARTRWLVELKRQSTARGTPEESTKSQVKIDYFPDGPVSLLRLEMPFPDEDTDFEGSPFNPRVGDVKVRAGFRAVPVAGRPVTSFFEITFPTAHPESLGSGKYQVAAGVRTAFPLAAGDAAGQGDRRTISLQVQQAVSVAGDEARKDVNQTKIELEWRHDRGRHYLKSTLKPYIDWVQDGKTGGVLEVEGGVPLSRHWAAAVMLGGLLWGKGVPGTYESRAEVKVSCRF